MEKYTLEEVRDIINSEGLGYAIQSFTTGDKMPTQKLKYLWNTAAKCMNEIEKIVGININ